MKNRFRGPSQIVKVGGKKQAVSQVMQVAESNGNTLDLFIYDEISGDGVDWWTGEEIKSETSADWFRQTLSEHKDAKQINLYVNSAGGDVVEAMGIRAQLLRHPAKVTGYVDGWAASAASFILTACDEVNMLTGSMQFLHDMWTMAIGNSRELRQVADEMDRMMVGNRQMYLEKAGDKLDEEKLIALMSKESWLTAEECVELGLADNVLPASDYKQMLKQISVPLMVVEPDPEPPEAPTVEPEERTEPEETPEEVIDTEDQPVNQLAIFMAALIGGEEEK